jgi:hypothetical protein
LNFSGITGNKLHHTYMPTHPEPMSQDILQFSDPKIFISYPYFEFCRSNSPYYTTHSCQSILNPKIYHKISDPKIFVSYMSLEFCRNNSPYFILHLKQFILNQYHKIYYKFQIRKFVSHTSLFWILSEQLSRLPHICVPILNQYSKDWSHNLRPKIFISQI